MPDYRSPNAGSHLDPAVAEHAWLIITRGSHIQDHPAEIAAGGEHGAKMIALSAPDAGNTWQQLEVVMSQWRAIEELPDVAGPFIWRATRTSLSRISLD